MRLHSLGQKRGLSLENENVEGDDVRRNENGDPVQTEIVEVPVEDPAAGAENLETELIEVADAEDVVADDAEIAENAEEARQALEGLKIVLEEAVAAGGMDRTGAKLFQMNLDQISSSVHLPIPMRAGPSLESYGGDASRLRASGHALEELSEKIKEFFKSIIEHILNGLVAIRNFFIKIWDGYDKLKKRAEALKTRAASTEGEVDKEFEIKGGINNLAIDGKQDKGAFKRLQAVASKVFAGYSVAEDIHAGLLDVVKAGQAGDFSKVGGEADKLAGKYVPFFTKLGLTKEGEIYVTERLPGNVQIVGVAPANGSELSKATLKLAAVEGKAVSDKSWPVLSKEEAAAQCDDVIAIADMLLEFRKNADEMSKIKKEIATAAKGIKLDKVEADDKVNFDILKSLVSTATAKVDQPWVPLASYCLKTGKYALDYVELSLKAHKKAA